MASQRQQKKENRLDLNRASVEEIGRIEGVGEPRARLIVEARKKRGRFGIWEDVAAIPGIGPMLLDKLRAATTLGGANGAGAPAHAEDEDPRAGDEDEDGESGAPDAEAEDDDEMSAEETMLMALMAVAEMDLGAAAAYEIVAGCFEGADDEVRDELLSFRADHLRHAAELDRLVAELGGEPLERPDPAESVLARLAEAAAALGPRAAMLAMLSIEQLTNSTYASLLDLDWDEPIRGILDSNRQDERRHLRWLEQHRERAEELDLQAGAPS